MFISSSSGLYHVLSGPSYDDSSNLEAKRLLGKASLSAASAFTSKTMNSFGKAWGRFRYFCDKMGYDLMEVSGLEPATWLVFRAEHISSPNMLESDLKAVTCFRQPANKPFVDYYAAEETLHGLLKEIEAKLLNRLGSESDMVEVLIREAIKENGPESIVGFRQAAIYALMYWDTARFEEVKELELR